MPLRFTLRQLEYFVAVGEAGSIAMAAAKLNISSPSISAAVSQLEKEFGLQLFVRKHAHGLSLTQAGRQFMQQSKTVLREAGALSHLAGDIQGNVQGPLAIGCLLTFAQMILPSLRRQFEAQYPDVQTRQTACNQAELFDHLRRAEIDLALTYDLDIPADLQFSPLAELPPYAMFAADHPMAQNASLTLEELAPEPLVLIDLPLSADYFMQLFLQAGLKPKVTERSHDMGLTRSLVANGFGYSIANIRPLTERAPDGSKLAFVPLSGDLRPLKLGIVTADGAENVLTVRAFMAHCAGQITDTQIPGMKMSLDPGET